MKCKGCGKEYQIHMITNYTVKYESWQAYNTCSKDCARESATKDGIEEEKITNIQG